MPVTNVDILIVGAGMAGAATAYHLARRGGRSLLILERELTAGAHSSGRNAAIIRECVDDPVLQPFLTEGADRLRRGDLAEFRRCGLYIVGAGNDRVADRVPPARGSGAWWPTDGTIDVAGLLRTYLAGIPIQYDIAVEGWSSHGSRLLVRTTRGEIECGLLVLAAGPWAGELGGIPMMPTNRHLFVTTPLKWIDPAWPVVWDGVHGLYFRPESGGLMLCCCDETAAAPGDYTLDDRVRDRLGEKLAALQPGLGALSIQTSWVGQRTFAPDRRFVIGFDPRDHRVFHVAGLGGHGVTSSWAVGRRATELILGNGSNTSDLFDVTRLL